MKKIVLIIIISLMFVACGTYKSLDLGRLTTGMTKAEVEYAIGPPNRVLAVNNRQEGFQEVLEYRTSRNEVYALEFWNDYLTGYEFLYDDVNYTPAPLPPPSLPPYGGPIYIIDDRPGRPEKPDRPGRPTPPETSRPTTRPPANGNEGSSRPNSERPTTRPPASGESSRPTTRPPANGNEGSSRPTTRPASGSSSDSGTRPSTRPASSETDTKTTTGTRR